MRIATIHEIAAYRVVSHGNGLAYSITRLDPAGGMPLAELFLQGDDAESFRDEWSSVENAYPNLATDTIIGDIFANYVED